MGKYGYVKKDELYHYGVKGMKWHKHLKSKFNLATGISQRRDLEDTEAMLNYNNYLNKHGIIDSSKNDQRVSSYKKQIEYRQNKYYSTPLGKLEKSSKVGRKAVNALLGSTSENAQKKSSKMKSGVIRTISRKDSVNKKDIRSRAEKVTTGSGAVAKGDKKVKTGYKPSESQKTDRKKEQTTYVPVLEKPASNPKKYALNWDTIEETPWLNPTISNIRGTNQIRSNTRTIKKKTRKSGSSRRQLK